jgi:maltose alpha-D-glucosyltransferase / alpha-amylase
MATQYRTGIRRQEAEGRPAIYTPDDDPLWYKDAVIYQLHVRSFHDSDGDGIGDFAGLTQKLDYLQDLGVTALWLLPFYPSPLRDDGYDIADYTNVHQSYGTIRDFQVFLREARRRGLKVITELVLNHTSDEHPWFQRARRSPAGSKWRDFYVWSDTPDRYRSARIIFKDFETSNWAWDPVANGYFWHRFYSHQPDLNFENPEVHRALSQAIDFWLGMGVDGLRLDAVPYLYEREGTSGENLPETHQYLKGLRAYVDNKFHNRMLLAEANQWPEDAAAYFGDGDECHMNFHFPLMPRLFMSVHMEDRFPIIDILAQTPSIPENCQWAMFLRNHDELTLEMVTDEDRDYMYRVYAQDTQARINLGIRRRLAPLLGNNRRRIELMNGLLFSLPGAPIIYYGDEIGMGDNIYLGDRNGVRTPMQWSGDRNAGFSRANPQRLYLPVILDPEYHYETVNVEAQHNNQHSLFWWMKRVIGLRQRSKAFGRGSIEFLYPENRKVLVFARKHEDETILVIANLSRFAQFAELDMSKYKGATPVELFGRTEFPKIGDLPYFITLGPHAFYWFELKREGEAPAAREPHEVGPRILTTRADWQELLTGRSKGWFEAILPEFLQKRRWFGGKARPIQSCVITEVIDVTGPSDDLDARLLLVKIEYVEGEPETYLLAVAFAAGEQGERAQADWPDSVVARVQFTDVDRSGVIYEATANRELLSRLFEAISRRRKFKGRAGQVVATPAEMFRSIRRRSNTPLDPVISRADQSNTSIIYGDRMILKLLRRPDVGVNPELEIGRFLNDHAPHASTPRLAGFMEYQRRRASPITLAILQEYVKNEGDAWNYTLDSVTSYLEDVLSGPSAEGRDAPLPEAPVAQLMNQVPPHLVSELMGPYLRSAELLGRRTGELHVALASSTEDPAFSPEPFTPFYQRAIYQAMRGLVAQVFPTLRRKRREYEPLLRDVADSVLSREDTIMKRFRSVIEQRLTGARIRIHGDFHLGQVLYTGKDFVIIDFEGEPARPLSERRLKRAPLRDVAGMVRSFHYAAYTALYRQAAVGMVRPEQFLLMETWARFWYIWASAAFLRGYMHETRDAAILPETPEELKVLLDASILEKAIYELGYELNNRPDWVRIPLSGILHLLESAD